MTTKTTSKTPRGLRKTMNVDENQPEIGSPKTPSRRRTYASSQKTPNSPVGSQNPRRSTRKINKPFQDYNDIVRPFSAKKSISIEIARENDAEGTFSVQKKKRDATKSISIEIKVKSNVDVENLKSETKNALKRHKNTKVGNTSETSIDMVKENDDLGVAPLEPEIELEKSEPTLVAMEKETYDLGVTPLEPEIDAEKSETASMDIIKENEDLGVAPLEPEIELEKSESALVDMEKENDDLGVAPLEREIELEKSESALVDREKENDDLGVTPLKPEIEVEKSEAISIDIKENDNLSMARLQPEKDVMEKNSVEVESKLIPIEKHDNEKITPEEKSECQVFEEMESLIFCDDDEVIDCNETTTNVNNDTFNASDCIILSPTENKEVITCQTMETKKMQSAKKNEKLEIHRQTQTPKKLQNVVMDFTPQNSKTLFTNTEILEEQKRRDSKLPRLPTPYKPKKNALINIEKEIEEAEEISPMKNIILPIIEMENENTMLQGICKQSLSSDIEKNNPDNVNTRRGRGNRVTFYSPANRTVVIEEFDVERKKQKDQKLQANENRIPIIPIGRSSPSHKMMVKPTTRIPTKKLEVPKGSVKTNLNTTTNILKATTSIFNVSSRFNTKPKTDNKHGVAQIPTIKVPQTKQNLGLSFGKEIPKLNKTMPHVQAATRIPTKKLEIPRVNMKTTLNSTTLTKASTTSILNATSMVDFKPKTATVTEKVTMRRERHLDMYKGRGDRLAPKSANARNEVIRGVRSNRRFDLQMQHRQNLEK